MIGEKLPVVAIVGRPNVGKSTLFNQIIGEKKAAVNDFPGLTIDRLYGQTEWNGKSFLLIDTGGYELTEKDPIKKHVREQVRIAIEQADVVLFMVDGRTGLTEIDYQIAELLRKNDKRIILTVNKCDTSKQMLNIADFYELGFEEVYPLSAVHKKGLTDVLDRIVEILPETSKIELPENTIKVAIAGQQNVGKSTLVNKILGEDRVIVSNIPGTTRDAVDVLVNIENNPYLLIDTAGLRRKAKIKDNIEKIATISTLISIRKADIVILMIDATRGIVSQDQKIAGFIEKEGKGCVIVVNKWDAVEKNDSISRDYIRIIRDKLYFIDYSPIVFTSALTGRNILKVFREVQKVYKDYTQQISTPKLNKALHKFLKERPPSPKKGKIFKFYYATQVKAKPPTFVLFVNKKDLLHFSYERYLKNRLRDEFSFYGTPFRLIFREKR